MECRTIYFNEERHQYTDDRGYAYISVTTLLGKFEDGFDKDYWSTAKAVEKIFVKEYGYGTWNYYKLQYGLEDLIRLLIPKTNSNTLATVKQEILDEWYKTNKDACDNGTTIHNSLENAVNKVTKFLPNNTTDKIRVITDLINDNYFQVSIEELQQTEIYFKYKQIYDYIVIKLNEGYSLYAEVGVYDVYNLISGRIDLLLINLETKDFEILDWKTNKDELHFESGYYKKVNGIKTNQWVKTDDCLKYPISHLPKCKGSTYSLQLSMYAYLVELYGYRCVGLTLCHIRVANSITTGVNEYDIKFHKIKYLKGEVKLIIRHYNNGKI